MTAAVTALNAAPFNAGIVPTTDTDAQVEAKLAVVSANLNLAVTNAQQALTASTTAINAVDGLKVRVDSYLRAFDAAVADADVATAANNVLVGALTQFGLDESVTATVATADGSTPAEGAAGDLQILAGSDVIAFYNGTTWTAVDGATVELTPAVQAAGKASYDANSKAAASLQSATDALGRIDPDYTGSAAVNVAGNAVDVFTGASEPEALNYVTNTVALADVEKNLTDFNDAVADYDTAAADAAELDTLLENVADAREAVEEAGYEPFLIGADEDAGVVITDFLATDGNDAFVQTDAIKTGDTFTIADFGFLGEDYLDVSGFIRGDIDAGNNSVLEYFVEADGANTVVTFETSVFGSNAATQEIYTITLTGVDASALVQVGDFLTI